MIAAAPTPISARDAISWSELPISPRRPSRTEDDEPTTSASCGRSGRRGCRRSAAGRRTRAGSRRRSTAAGWSWRRARRGSSAEPTLRIVLPRRRSAGSSPGRRAPANGAGTGGSGDTGPPWAGHGIRTSATCDPMERSATKNGSSASASCSSRPRPSTRSRGRRRARGQRRPMPERALWPREGRERDAALACPWRWWTRNRGMRQASLPHRPLTSGGVPISHPYLLGARPSVRVLRAPR